MTSISAWVKFKLYLLINAVNVKMSEKKISLILIELEGNLILVILVFENFSETIARIVQSLYVDRDEILNLFVLSSNDG